MTAREQVLITPDELGAALRERRKLVVLDVRLGGPGESARSQYEAGHVPGAVLVALQDLQGPPSEFSGVSPLPEPAALQRNVRRWGIDPDTDVVVYGSGLPVGAGRAWLVLARAGVHSVRLLDGGIEAWVESGGELVTEEPATEAGTFVVSVAEEDVWTISIDEAADVAQRGLLVDVRPTATYTGELQAADARAGHIPGAVNAPITEIFDRGRLKGVDELRTYFAGLGLGQGGSTGVYCGGGVAAALEALALKSIGIDVPVFVGSWSAWAADPSRPVERGA